MIRSGTYRVYLKHIMFVLLMIAFSCYPKAISAKGSARLKVAVTLCGGGANDFSHIGLFKVLEEEEVTYDIFLGTSMGGIIGRSYAIGHGAYDLREIALSQNWQELLSDSIPRKDLDQVSKMNKQRYVINLHFDKDESAAKTREINIGMRLNSRSATSVILNSTSRDTGRFLNLISMTADLSINPKAELLLESHRPEGFNYSLTIEGMYKYLKMKPDRGSIAHTDFFYYSAGLYSSQEVLQYLNAGLGIKGEYYAGQIKAMTGDTIIPVTPSDEFYTDLLGYLAFDNLDDFYFPCNGREI